MNDIRKVRKAVFPVAGLGSRFLPATKAMPKELLPIIDKPIIQYAVEEAIAAEIETLIFVTGRSKRAIEDHFDSNPELEAALRKTGKETEADMICDILPKGVECIFVRQSAPLGLGHAILCAKRAVSGEDFAIILADDFIKSPGLGVTSDLLNAYYTHGNSMLSVMKVPMADVNKYGMVKPGETLGRVAALVEKPSIENTPSQLASIGRYVLNNKIFKILEELKPGYAGEIQLADAINNFAKRNVVCSMELDGIRFDCGSKIGYLNAIINEANERNYDGIDFDLLRSPKTK